MNEWEQRRKQSWGYYVCLLLFVWPVLLLPIQFIIAPYSITIDALGLAFMYEVLIVGLAMGCGVRYRFRGINPESRTVMSTIDAQYFQDSDYNSPGSG